MNTVALMYHDVTPERREDASGFPGGDAARYKLTPAQFADHLLAIMGRIPQRPLAIDRWDIDGRQAAPLFLTFDDGGASAMMIADRLDRYGWIGHFFVTAAYIGRPGFVSADHIRDLRRRGHVVGSHSFSHPLRMGRLPESRLFDEWKRSADVLAEATGEAITTASVPGGYYSAATGRTAAAAGIRYLFTSEPLADTHEQDGVLVVGRYVVRRSTPPETVAAVVSGALAPRVKQFVSWELKKAAKVVAGRPYLALRDRVLGHSDDVQWGDSSRLSKKTP